MLKGSLLLSDIIRSFRSAIFQTKIFSRGSVVFPFFILEWIGREVGLVNVVHHINVGIDQPLLHGHEQMGSETAVVRKVQGQNAEMPEC